ncbi:MAG: c-type cytochrome [Pirellulales bacterium]|nr:c-type cytochrome [Pirellulales bacterium]
MLESGQISCFTHWKRNAIKLFGLCLLFCSALRTLAAADPFAELVRPTEPLSPQAEQQAFHLPPGFEIQLVAAEPDLRKPMNMAFDVTGRLWFTESREYPYPVRPPAAGRDSVRILSDFDAHGKAGKVTIFADGLNIPIGLYPFRSSNKSGAQPTWKCIVWSIPHIWLLEDTDGDDRADRRTVLYGPLGWESDTHGNLASFRRAANGWLYGTHGFNNTTTMRGRDGSEIKMQSGNTWRVRIDGDRVEQITYGQVNPFGLCVDPRGFWYTADCHSSPIYQLIRGAHYPSFGKPHDGLDFAPTTINHSHNSTGICGITYLDSLAWPDEYQDNILIGNVVTSRINRDKITFTGSSPSGAEQADFVSTDDPWFRPVDLQLGPDGALYVADFYNRIIGHYEVPLDHPGRDRERGRIWRIVSTSHQQPAPAGSVTPSNAPATDSPTRDPRALPLDLPGLIAELASPNATRQNLALHEICDVHGVAAAPSLREALRGSRQPRQQAQLLWALMRCGGVEISDLEQYLTQDEPLLRITALRIAAEMANWRESLWEQVLAALRHENAFVRRAAAETLALRLDVRTVQPLLESLVDTPAGDTHLRHTLKVALRNQLRKDATVQQLWREQFFKSAISRQLETILPALPPETIALIRLSWIEDQPGAYDLSKIGEVLPTLLKYCNAEQLTQLRERVQPAQPQFDQRELTAGRDFLAAYERLNLAPPAELRAWVTDCALRVLDKTSSLGWYALEPNGQPSPAMPWTVQPRDCDDQQPALVISSFPAGEQFVGVLRSADFSLPTQFSFYLAGHDGLPDQPAGRQNRIRLRLANGQIIQEAFVPRSDVAQRISWDLSAHAGQTGYLELIDANNTSSYAWLAVGRFSRELDPHGELTRDPRQWQTDKLLAVELAGKLRLRDRLPGLIALLRNPHESPAARLAAARALATLDEEEAFVRIGNLLTDNLCPADLREKLGDLCGEGGTLFGVSQLAAALKSAPERLQLAYSLALAGSARGAEAFLAALAEGRVSAHLLRHPALLNKLRAHPQAASSTVLAAALERLPPLDEQFQKLIAARQSAVRNAAADATRGRAIFTKNCAVCHKLGNEGALVGPQLDGIGARGMDRLLEDVLDPNRNVDRAFRASVLTLKDGQVVNGLVRRETDSAVILANQKGEEFTVEKANLDERRETDSSLMPSVAETLPDGELADLLAYLLAQQGK